MTFTEVDLRSAVNHLAFDMFHFKHYAATHQTLLHDANHRVCYQATIYSMLLHFRVFLHFFYGQPKRDDCCAEHFRILPGFEQKFPASLHAVPIWEEELRIHLNKRLAHFTATRWKQNQPPLAYYTARFPEILDLVNRFEAALPGEFGHHLLSRNASENTLSCYVLRPTAGPRLSGIRGI
jgi:hypothetical protein